MPLEDNVLVVLSFLVGPVVVGLAIMFDSSKDSKSSQENLDSPPGGYLDENYYTRNEPYQRYEGGDYER